MFKVAPDLENRLRGLNFKRLDSESFKNRLHEFVVGYAAKSPLQMKSPSKTKARKPKKR